MLLRSALRLRPAISSALLASVLIAAPAAAHAQASSKAIAALQPASQHDRIAAHPDFAPLTQLDHQLPGWVQGRPQSSAHAIDLSTPISVSLLLNRDPSVEAAFNQLLADQQNPSSPLYHRWLTPQQVGSLFGPTANDLAALTTWLTSQGLKVDSIAPSGVIVHASGSAAIVGNAFHTTFAMFSPDEGLTAAPRLSAVSEPSIPSALTPLVRSIQGLGALEVHPLNIARPVQGTPRPASSASPSAGVQPLFTNGSDHYITPGDFGVIFDVNSVYHVGNTGAKIGSTPQRIAVIEESRVVNTDITEFEALVGLTTYTPTVVIPTGATDPGSTANGYQSEATLDVDRVIGTAPGAGVDLVVAKQLATSGGIFAAIEHNIDTLIDPIMTISFGGCEASNGLANTNAFDTLAKNGAAEGITTLVSSGDSGAAGCDTSFSQAPAVQTASINFLCSTTYATCVGGTEFNDLSGLYWNTNSSTLVSAISYIPEGGWNEPSSMNPNTGIISYAPAASGGGISTYIARPSWQTGTGVPSGNFRLVPDVSFPASQHDGYFACLAFNGGDCNNNRFEVFSGTSASAPSMAGVVALINTKLGTASGNINPLLYQISASTPTAFHDITVATSGVTGCAATTPSMCNNGTPGPTTLTGGLAGDLLTTGYDEVTGLGSLDVNNFVAAAASGGQALISTALALTAPAAITAGGSSTFTVTLTPASGSTGTPTGTVQFYSNSAAIGLAVTLTSNTVTSAAQTFPTAGTYSITAIYSGDGVFASSSAPGVPLVVSAVVTNPESFTLTASPTTLTLAPGAISGNISNLSITPSGGFTGTVTLSPSTCVVTNASNLSVPPTCALSIASLTGSATATVTITSASGIGGCSAGLAPHNAPWSGRSTGIVLAGLLLLLPFRKLRTFRSFASMCLLAVGFATLTGCGGNGTTPPICNAVVAPATTAGNYSIKVTGTSGSVTSSATINVTIN